MKTSNILRKIFAASLAVALVGGAFVTTPVGSMIGANTSVSAVTYSSPVVTVGDFQYCLYSDGTAEVVGYKGTKDLSTTHFGMPTVVHAKDVNSTWQYLQTSGDYKITRMQAGIFSGCKFKTLSLPRYLEILFGGFIGLEVGGYFIDDSNSYFSNTYYSGAYGLYNKSNTTLYAYPSNPELYVSGFGTATKGFPSTMTRIEDEAFANCKLGTVTIPASVTYMGDRAFYNSNVHYITFKGNAPTFRFTPCEQTEDHGPFEGAAGLWQIKIEGTGGNYSTDSYGNLYNRDQTKLVLVPQGKTSAFNIASTCTEIGNYAFRNSNANGPVIYDQVKTIGEYAFSKVKSNFKVYCLKDTPTDTFVKNHNIPYTYIYEYTTASDGVTITKYNGPYSSPGVPTKINGKDVIAIGNEAFKNNDTLSAVYLYSPINSIGNNAFYDCDNLAKVSMPYTVTTIGDYAFYSCDKLNFTTLPSRLTKIGTYAFGYCKALTEVTIPNSVTQINTGAFFNCSNLASVKLGTGLKTIGAYDFEGTALTNQYIPKNVTSIGGYAFGYDYVDSNHLFHDINYYISGYPDSAAETYCKNYQIIFKPVIQYTTANGEVTIDKYTGTDTSVVIPASIGGKPVTGIKGYAFNGTNVTSVTLPSSMTKLSGYAFYGASKLTSVIIPSSITSIGEYAFKFCSSLKSITIPATVKSIGNGAFYGCTSLANVYFREGLQTIGGYAFENTALTAVSLPSTVTSIGSYAFADKWENSTHNPVTGFTMTGYVDTAAETFANNNSHITFKPLYKTFSNSSTINKTSITLGESVTVTGSATGGKKPYKYAVSYKKSTDSGYTTLQSYSTNTKVDFKPTSSGTYTVMVTAADYRNVTSSKTFTVTVKAPALVNESTVSATEIIAGNNIIINGKASGGEGAYTYAANISSNNGGSFTTLRAYAADSAITFVPEKSGTYILRSFIKDSNGTVTSKDFTVTVKAPELVNESAISADSITAGTSVTVNCKAAGGEGGYVYTVQYQMVGNQWESVQEYSTNTTATITFDKAGDYKISVTAKDDNGTEKTKYFDVTVTAAQTALTNNSTIAKTTITLGEKISVACAAEGGTAPYLYGVYYKKTTAEKWTTAQSYKANAAVVFKPSTAVEYNVCVKVKDSKGKIEKKYFTVKVVKPLENKSILESETIKKGESVKVTGRASGGVAPYLYGVYYKKATADKWATVQNYKSNVIVKFKPTAAVKYDVCVKVKDSTGKIEKKYFVVTVTA